jgi:hypothetical protein
VEDGCDIYLDSRAGRRFLEPVYDLEAGYCREDSKVIIGQPSVR